MDQKDVLLTSAQVASLFQISTGTVTRLLRTGRLPGIKLGRKWRPYEVGAIWPRLRTSGSTRQQSAATGDGRRRGQGNDHRRNNPERRCED